MPQDRDDAPSRVASKSFVDRMTSGMADPEAASEDEVTDEERRAFGLPPYDRPGAPEGGGS